MKIKVLKNGRHLPSHSKKERRKTTKLKLVRFSVVIKSGNSYCKAPFTRFNNKRLLVNKIYTYKDTKYKCVIRNGSNVIFEQV